MNTNYTDYQFTADGINFVSRIADHSPFLGAIKNLPAEDFIALNISAITDLLGRPSLMKKQKFFLS